MQCKLIALNNLLTLNLYWFVEVVFSAITVETLSLYEGGRGGERGRRGCFFLSGFVYLKMVVVLETFILGNVTG